MILGHISEDEVKLRQSSADFRVSLKLRDELREQGVEVSWLCRNCRSLLNQRFPILAGVDVFRE